jgi:lipid-A-disaccharide synthase-like uncharacterized protein
MHETLFTLKIGGAALVITAWKLIGYTGVLMFGSRWVFQLVCTAKEGKPTFPLLFWILSFGGSVMTLSYFIFGKNDSVGILANLFPATVATYNLIMEMRWRTRQNSLKNGEAANPA